MGRIGGHVESGAVAGCGDVDSANAGEIEIGIRVITEQNLQRSVKEGKTHSAYFVSVGSEALRPELAAVISARSKVPFKTW